MRRRPALLRPLLSLPSSSSASQQPLRGVFSLCHSDEGWRAGGGGLPQPSPSFFPSPLGKLTLTNERILTAMASSRFARNSITLFSVSALGAPLLSSKFNNFNASMTLLIIFVLSSFVRSHFTNASKSITLLLDQKIPFFSNGFLFSSNNCRFLTRVLLASAVHKLKQFFFTFASLLIRILFNLRHPQNAAASKSSHEFKSTFMRLKQSKKACLPTLCTFGACTSIRSAHPNTAKSPIASTSGIFREYSPEHSKSGPFSNFSVLS
mmetsp:Transcript_16450/g.33903  ORF Transcript_16450/g.33903 Transcript_16450/m.33903 type:complete len:265 (-) Transcript_16450:264-1058(-)